MPRDAHEHARDVARSLAGTETFEQSRRERKKVEMRFAHLKAPRGHRHVRIGASSSVEIAYRASRPADQSRALAAE
jgi:hypothetical protein